MCAINGGTAPYFTHTTGFIGAPNVGDSLAAIKKAVFDDKKITMEKLIDALDKNFQGEEEVYKQDGVPRSLTETFREQKRRSRSKMDDIRGLIFHIIHGSFVDGHGIRTTVFLKGCPLKCV